MPVWTEAQQKAIEQRGKNLLVSAAAGSGKTAVLVERIRRIITDEGVSLSGVLVLTFTDAAASEMRQKLTDRIAESLDKKDDPRLHLQLQQMGSANIGTFHSFGLKIIKRYYYTIGLDPGFSVIDEFGSKILIEDAMDALFEESFTSGDPSFTEFLSRYSTATGERAAREMIIRLFTFIRNQPDPYGWLNEQVGALSMGADQFTESSSFKRLYNSVEKGLSEFESALLSLGELLDGAGCTGLYEKNSSDIENLRLAISAFSSGEDWDEAGELLGFKFSEFRATKDEKESYEPIKSLVTSYRKKIKDRVKGLIAWAFAKPLDEMLIDIAETAPFAETLAGLTRRFDELYTERKRADGVVDYGDIEHLSLSILENEQVCAEYREKFSHIFIDEYQDCNYIQDELISRICRKDNVFMVGDVKQSIYRFRRAEPTLFIDKYKSYPNLEDCEVIDLNSNFRSKGGVIDSVNDVFEHLMSGRVSPIRYDEHAKLNKGIISEEKWDIPTSLYIVDATDEQDGGDPDIKNGGNEDSISTDTIIEMKDSQREAVAAAAIIREARGTEIFDARTGQVRALRNRDIVVLLSEVKTSAAVFAGTLNSLGIAAYAESGEGLLDTVEVETFLNLLRTIDNPHRDVPLAGTLYSQVFGFTVNELVAIRAAHPEGHFYEAFLSFVDDDSELGKKCAAAAEKLEAWRDEEHFMELAEFIWKLMKDSGYYDYAGALANGAARQANLRTLIVKAGDFQTGHIRRLFSFLKYIELTREQKIPLPPAKLITEGEDVVRIMSIHKSKGLEFPFVIVGMLGRKLSHSGSESDMSLHKDAGFALRWEAPDRLYYRRTLLQSLANDISQREDAEEKVRLLYVAMTRAMDRLVLLGSLKKAEEKLSVYELMDPEMIEPVKSQNYLDMLLPTISEAGIKPQVLTIADISNEAHGNPQGESPVELMMSELDMQPGIENDEIYKEIDSRLSWKYPFEAEQTIKSKYSVSELSRLSDLKSDGGGFNDGVTGDGRFSDGDDKKSRTALFMAGSEAEQNEDEGKLITAAERGTALHRALEKLDYSEALSRVDDAGWFVSYLDGLVNRGFLTQQERDSVSTDTLRKYAGTTLFARAAKSAMSGGLGREKPFVYKMQHDGREVIVQGVIDCFFEEDDGLVLVDFKSGGYKDDSEIITRYGEQVRIYRNALNEITGKPVKETLLYMTDSGRVITVE